VWYSKEEDYSIYTSAKWSCKKMNRMLVEKSRCMLSGVRLGKELWAKAVGTTCYLVNRSPSSALDEKTPQEVWNGNKIYLTHLKVFGCEAYVHVQKENMSKLDKKVEKCIFIGYKMVSKVISFGTKKLRRLCIVKMLYLEK
jgi:hypothetical protein